VTVWTDTVDYNVCSCCLELKLHKEGAIPYVVHTDMAETWNGFSVYLNMEGKYDY